MRKRKSNSRTHITRIRNSTRRKGTPNSGSGKDGQLAHKKRYAYQTNKLTKISTKEEALVDRDMEVKYWHHPA